MTFKTTFFTALLTLLSFSAFCQDKIYKRDGSMIPAMVKEVGIKAVTYKKYENQNGPDYTIAKDDIEKIRYQNGTEDVFEITDDGPRRPSLADIRAQVQRQMEERRSSRPKTYMAPNVITIAPIQLSDNGFGLGASYERSLDKAGIISFYLPVYLTYSVNSVNNNYYGNGPSTVTYDPMFYVAPGIKIYPTGNQGKVKYSIGPNIVIATGSQTDNYVYNPNGTYVGGTSQSRFMMGVMVVNTLNVCPSPKLFMALDLGLGGTYVNKTGGELQGATTLVEFSFRIGYRFK